jgi:prepilin-type N-terminal cleavage/methylation domain-containing protein
MKNLSKRFQKKFKFKKGFTLIELLVVVAIIGILASVVLASLNSARSRGNDAAAKSNLTNAGQQGEIFWNTNTSAPYSYTSVCTNAGPVGGANPVGGFVLSAAKAEGLSSYGRNGTGSGTTATCNDSAAAWAAEVPLNGSTNASPLMWCVDSTDKSKQESTSIGAGTSCS